MSFNRATQTHCSVRVSGSMGKCPWGINTRSVRWDVVVCWHFLVAVHHGSMFLEISARLYSSLCFRRRHFSPGRLWQKNIGSVHGWKRNYANLDVHKSNFITAFPEFGAVDKSFVHFHPQQLRITHSVSNK